MKKAVTHALVAAATASLALVPTAVFEPRGTAHIASAGMLVAIP